MYLKKLELIGFKSFAEPTTVVFQPGITGIVGPNGCGKSNIVDAVLWVLGEQSTKTLRSDRMEDVIFNGSETRRPLNYSEVILTVGDVSGEAAGQFGDYQELAISRRLFRTGESEYRINKIACRLKDIRDLLIDTGAGHKGHTIIEQGKVDQLLNASPLERRELIEETAGISKYKLRKAEAERKLDATRQNLLRVSDIIGEVKRQILALDRQAKKTRTYQTLQAEARGLEIQLLLDEYRTHQSERSELERQIAELKAREASFRADQSRAEARLQTLKTALAEKETALAGFRQSVHETEMAIQRQENRIELLHAQIHSWDEQQTKLTADRARLGQFLDQSVALEAQSQHQLKEVSSKLDEARGRMAGLEADLARIEEAFGQKARAVEDRKSQLFGIVTEQTEVKNRMAVLESRAREIHRIQEKGRAEIAAAEQQLDQTRKALRSEESALARIQENLDRTDEEEARLGLEMAHGQASLKSLAEEILNHRGALALNEARLDSFREREKAASGVYDYLKGRTEFQGRLRGVVADLFEVPKALEPAVEAVLGERLKGILFHDHAEIRLAIQRLKSDAMGRGLFLPQNPRPENIPAPLPKGEGLIGPILNQVQVRPGYEFLAQTLLGSVFLVRDIETALSVWTTRSSGWTFVTSDGDVLEPSGPVWAGRRSESETGHLKTRRVIRELENEIGRIRSELASAESRQSRLAQEMEALAQKQHDFGEEKGRRHQETAALRQKIALLEADRQRLEERLDLLRVELAEEAREADAVEAGRVEAGRELEAHLHTQAETETALGNLNRALEELTEKRERTRTDTGQLRVELSSLIHRTESLDQERARLREEQASNEEQQRRIVSELEALASKRQSAHRDIQATEAAIRSQTEELTVTQRRLSVQSESCAVDLAEIKRLETGLAQVRSELGGVERPLRELELRESESRLRQIHLVDQAATHYQISLEPAASQPADAIIPAQVRQHLQEIKSRLDSLGPVNLAAIEEYRELDERYRFLTGQESDLKQSMEDLHSAIQKINRTTREMFLSAYTALREKFRTVFAEFFEGGLADLVLLDTNLPLESGIEIVAQPPGKRLKSITLLSGGEKALTAIALLFASFLIHPSPFCILDEIDAPLDEENIRRFLKVLRKMLDHSQFLIITHNKRTMEHSDLLYGVTMEEAGVSKLVSVKLDANGNGYSTGRPAAERESSTRSATA